MLQNATRTDALVVKHLNVTSGKGRCRSFRKFRSKIRNVRYQTSTFNMADPSGTETVEEAKKSNNTRRPQPRPRNVKVSDVTSDKKVRLGDHFGIKN